MGQEKVKLFVLPSRGDTYLRVFNDKIATRSYVRKPLKVKIDSRPAVLRFKQVMEMESKDGSKPKQVTVEGYFRRMDFDSYLQMTKEEVEKLLKWMSQFDKTPQSLTLLELETALISKIEMPEPQIIVPGEAKSGIEKSRIILP